MCFAVSTAEQRRAISFVDDIDHQLLCPAVEGCVRPRCGPDGLRDDCPLNSMDCLEVDVGGASSSCVCRTTCGAWILRMFSSEIYPPP